MSQIVDTSLEAYLQIKPVLGKKRRQVYELIRNASMNGFDMTNMEIATALHWSICRVTGRVFELRQMGMVVSNGKRRCGCTGNNAYAWKANP